MLLFLTYLGIEYHVQKHITKFLGKFMLLSLEDSITQLIYFLESLRTQRFIGLFPVPRTFLAQLVKNIQKTAESL